MPQLMITNPRRLATILVLTQVCAMVAPAVVGAENVPKPPNILLILADDLAWADLGCYGHPWHDTAAIDALADGGMRFTQGYAAAPICSASRAALLTGKTTARLGFEFVTKNEPGHQQIEGEVPLQTPPFTLNLPLEERTIAERLAALDYQTAFFGKWHLNAHHQRYLGWSPTHGPLQQGFAIAEEDFGSHPYSWGRRQPPATTIAGEFPADSMIDRAEQFVSQDHQRPFFLIVSLFHVHTPVKTRCEWLLDNYADRVPADSPNRDQRLRYAAFVEELDHYVGNLLARLDEAGLADDTLVVFTSDNGGHPAFTANGPLRGSKWNLYEGGIRVPFVARWPGHIAPGSESDAPVVGYDLLPTFVALAGGQADDTDGRNLSLILAGTHYLQPRDLLWHFPYYHPERGYAKARETIGVDDFAVSKTRPHSAIRRDRYKLLQFYEDDRIELYDLQTDPGEQQDLSRSMPAICAELKTALHQRLQESHARLPSRRSGGR
jgi:arylsulfatase A-like enzyme